MNSFALAQDMEAAFNSVGSSMMSADFAAKLLAFTFVIGDECTVLHKGMNAGIGIASQKFNIKGGEVPESKSLELLRTYIKELKKDYEDTPWLDEVYGRYKIERPKQSKTKKNEQTKGRSKQGEMFT